MKLFLNAFFCLLMATICFSQQLPISAAAVQPVYGKQEFHKSLSGKKEYLTRHRWQNAIAISLAGVAVMSLAAATSDYLHSLVPFQENYSNPKYGLSIGIGATAAAASLILFSMAAGNKRHAAATEVFLDVHTAPLFRKSFVIEQSIPVVGIKLNL